MTSSADLFDDTWPHTHGTPDGYENGCKSSACPAADQYGMSCKTAWRLSRSDYRYQKLAKAGADVATIADEFGFAGTSTPAPTTPTPKTAKGARRIVDEPAPVADEPETDTSSDQVDTERVETATEAPETAAEHAKPATEHTPAAIRTWARDWGYDVKAKGKIPTEVIERYWEAHGLLDPAITPANQTSIKKPEPQDPAAEAPAGPLTLPVDKNPIKNPDALERPDYGTMNLEDDLAAAQTERDTAIEERDDARSLARRLWDELDRLERARAQDLIAHAASIDSANTLTDLLQTALTETSNALHVTQRGLELALRKWDEATRQPTTAPDHLLAAFTGQTARPMTEIGADA